MITRTGIINDLHIPWHDPTALRIALQILLSAKITRLILNGDILDFWNVNSYGQHPDVKTALEHELGCGFKFLKMLREYFPKIEIIYLLGNHEDRLDREVIRKAPSLWNIVRIEDQLHLEDRGIKCFPYNHRLRLEDTNFFIQHSPPSYAKNGAMTSLEKKLDTSSIYGCTHREQKASRTGDSGNKYTVFYNGWLGSTTLTPEHKRVFSYMKGHEDWQQCFSIVTVENGRHWFNEQISITNGMAHYGGKVYR